MQANTNMKKAMPWIRMLFLLLFFVLLRQGFLLVWLAIYGLSLILPLLWGRRLYCLLACPMNTLMSWLTPLKKKLGLKNRPAPKWLAGGNMVWISLLISIGVFVLSRRVAGKDFPMMLVWMLVSLVLTLFYHPDVFHDQVCPFGLPQGCAAKASLLDEDARAKAQSYQGFSASVLGQQNPGIKADKDLKA